MYLKFGCVRFITFSTTAIVSFLLALLSQDVLPAENSISNQNYRFEHLTMEEGLSYNCIEVILQDRQGYLWFGSRNGLNRYDGYLIKTFYHDPEDPNSLRDNVIESIYEDQSGTLWIGTQNGWLEKYDPVIQGFKHFKIGSHVLSILEDSTGNLWIGTQDPGLFQFNKTTERAVLIWQGKFFTSILEDNQGDIWAASPDAGLGKYNLDRNNCSVF